MKAERAKRAERLTKRAPGGGPGAAPPGAFGFSIVKGTGRRTWKYFVF